MRTMLTTAAALAALAAAPAALADSHGGMMKASAAMMDADGNDVGTVSFSENGNGVLIQADLSGLPPGVRAFHLHETGSCEPDFSAAGGHYNPEDKEHGTLNPAGAHAGDTPNIWIAESGEAVHHVVTPDVTLAEGEAGTLFDDDGSAVVIHENADSYEAEAGAGGRIACGVIEAAGG